MHDVTGDGRRGRRTQACRRDARERHHDRHPAHRSCPPRHVARLCARRGRAGGERAPFPLQGSRPGLMSEARPPPARPPRSRWTVRERVGCPLSGGCCPASSPRRRTTHPHYTDGSTSISRGTEARAGARRSSELMNSRHTVCSGTAARFDAVAAAVPAASTSGVIAEESVCVRRQMPDHLQGQRLIHQIRRHRRQCLHLGLHRQTTSGLRARQQSSRVDLNWLKSFPVAGSRPVD